MTSTDAVASRPLQYAKAIAQSDLPPGTRATCWALATYADNTSGKAWPSVAQLSAATGLSSPVISKHTTHAEAAGYLHKDRRMNNSITYTITVPRVAQGVNPSQPYVEPQSPPWAAVESRWGSSSVENEPPF